MKTVIINFTDDEGKKIKAFSSGSMKTGLMDKIFDIAERAESLDIENNKNLRIKEVREFFQDLKSLIIAVFHYKFDLEELNENVEHDELMKVFNDICNNIGKEMTKN